MFSARPGPDPGLPPTVKVVTSIGNEPGNNEGGIMVYFIQTDLITGRAVQYVCRLEHAMVMRVAAPPLRAQYPGHFYRGSFHR